MRFSLLAGQRVPGKGGKRFSCPACRYECHADFNASVNVHHSFFREFHWQPRAQKQRLKALSGYTPGGRWLGRGTPVIQLEARSQMSEHVNVVGLLLVHREHVPTRMFSWTASQAIPYRNAAGTLMGRTV